ncbi:hypothetical protein AC41_1116 [Escherichia coli 2-011-08_S3_C3]|uniref:Uncharacterized protein n=1 Tax=Shigella boydii serotype 18 (strain CDC 3083-94 / BS512) TaxID=344609 RepID=B2U012_SHIB3|nr:hypothetical protein SbBS512_E1437 [Shigella boydii CDC 3083-94]EKI43280.1 hypothetical protein EC07798_1746 [Escherichia coli 07798]EYE02462.1 hypothetical protein AD37_1401 [Escherichia coli 1-110-08_S4_C3]EYE03321.1 hypothetical protein AD08_1458 [Escherichia coli 1-110-08_S4_C2]EZJ26210.1 hypothetical protein AD38_1420 [Escherichia coli 1-176-05_S4_C3]KDA85837.1 hypothetical protein AC41_1116 [Escherichia coli 2-011-08_S3_C3]KDT58132.1 hypothetical protein AC05_4762 [Escherichia coli 3
MKSAIVINIFIGVMKIAQSVASEQGYREYMSKSGNIWF